MCFANIPFHLHGITVPTVYTKSVVVGKFVKLEEYLEMHVLSFKGAFLYVVLPELPHKCLLLLFPVLTLKVSLSMAPLTGQE